MQYNMSEEINGVRQPDRVVTEEFFKNFTSLEARKFSENLGGKETIRRKGLEVYCTSTSPDGDYVRKAVFIPVEA